MTERLQLLWLFVLAAPVACVAWTITHEEIFKEFRDWCVRKSERSRHLYERKFFYLFTCEYCFSHYVAGAVVLGTGYRLLLMDWRGAILAWFTLVWSRTCTSACSAGCVSISNASALRSRWKSAKWSAKKTATTKLDRRRLRLVAGPG